MKTFLRQRSLYGTIPQSKHILPSRKTKKKCGEDSEEVKNLQDHLTDLEEKESTARDAWYAIKTEGDNA